MKHKTKMDFAYEFLLEGPKTVRQVADHLGTSTKSAASCLYRLRSYGKAKYAGDSRYGMYYIPDYTPPQRHFPRIGIWGL
jgi:predicted HTH transcriptional regulator